MSVPDWHQRAYCRDDPTPDLFHPNPGAIGHIRAAKAACSRCPVRSDCLAEALADPTLTGVWGGTTDSERAALRNGEDRCGTHRGYSVHKRRGQVPCRPCLDARAAYARERRATA